jgi:hypothetical protein
MLTIGIDFKKGSRFPQGNRVKKCVTKA